MVFLQALFNKPGKRTPTYGKKYAGVFESSWTGDLLK